MNFSVKNFDISCLNDPKVINFEDQLKKELAASEQPRGSWNRLNIAATKAAK